MNTTARYRHWYVKLLHLYPKPYRERFGEGMEQTFNDLCRERGETGEGLLSFVLWTFADTLVGIIREGIKFMTPRVRQFTLVIFGVATAIAILVASYLDLIEGEQLVIWMPAWFVLLIALSAWMKKGDKDRRQP